MTDLSYPSVLPNLLRLGFHNNLGFFAGLTTKADGTHCSVFLIPGMADDLTWDEATEWAKSKGGELPSRTVAALLRSTTLPCLPMSWIWTSDEGGGNFAWNCFLADGGQLKYTKSALLTAIAVKLVPLEDL
jgi:hypothetical protein